LFELGPDQGRRTLDAVQSGPVTKPTVDTEDTTVPGGPSGQVSVRILRPQAPRRPLAVILYLHGPGWVFWGCPDLTDRADGSVRLPA
jgi:acetyl esterase/lipase